jgi:DNA-binding response OmpR family regulator
MAGKPPLILIVDDEADLRQLLTLQLSQVGFRVAQAFDGYTALEQFEQVRPDLILLDVMMPQMDGWEVLRELRKRSDIPVIMLTALSSEKDQVNGLDGGVDDYIVKPFLPRQLMARIRAVLRRAGRPAATLVYGPLIIDLAAHEVILNDRILPLTKREYNLLEELVRHPGRAFTRGELLARCWGSNHDGVDRVVDVYMASLRRKLDKERRLITTVRGIGYRFTLSA